MYEINKKRVNTLKENLEISKQGFYMFGDNKVNIVKPRTRLIKTSEQLEFNLHNKTEIEFVNNTTIGAVMDEPEKSCTLNFASYKTPGGGVLKGYGSQEESLCYPSNLYSSLLEFKTDFYDNHIIEGMNYGLYTSEALYSEDVSIFRTEGLELIMPCKVMNVITMAAPYAKTVRRYRPYLENRIYPALKARCQRVLEIAASNKQEVLILGAFGCGVFGNNLDDLIEIWYELLNNDFKDVFKKVIFAVPEESSLDKFIKRFSI